MIVLIVVAFAHLAAAADTQPAAGTPPAKVVNPRAEADLTRVELSPEAVNRIGIRIGVVEQRALQRARVVGGEVVVPSQPATGTNVPALVFGAPPDRVQAAQALVTAQGDVQAAKVEVEAASVELGRARRVLAGGAGSARAVDEARAKLALAQARLEAARQRHDTLATAAFGTTDRLWVRVPLYAGDVNRIASDAPASIAQLGANADEPKRPAKRVRGPSTANPAAAAVDLYFEVANADGALQPGEQVDVTLALRESEPAVVVPWSAVLHDVHGGEWIYEQVGPHAFSRRRVQVRYVSDGVAALANAPQPGTSVVIEGAAELFSTEFGVGK